MSRAATALRRGDLTAAAAAVPAVAAGAAVADEATQLLTAGQTSAATRLMPTPAAAASLLTEEHIEEDPAPQKKRSRWTWPLIALIALLALVLGGHALQRHLQPERARARPHNRHSDADADALADLGDTDTDAQLAAHRSVVARLEGKTCDDARAILEENDLVADCQVGNAATQASDVGLIYNVNPTGGVEAGTTITVRFYAEQTPLETPGTPDPPERVGRGRERHPGVVAAVHVPVGTGSVTSYNFTATNGTFDTNGQSTASFAPDARNAALKVSNSAGQTLRVTYTVSCSGSPDRQAGPRARPRRRSRAATARPRRLPTATTN